MPGSRVVERVSKSFPLKGNVGLSLSGRPATPSEQLHTRVSDTRGEKTQTLLILACPTRSHGAVSAWVSSAAYRAVEDQAFLRFIGFHGESDW